MAIIKCKMCGGDLVFTEGSTVAQCEYCGSLQTIPELDDEKKLIQFERAERLRKQCEFDKAAGIYEAIVSEFRQEAEAYWGLVLCKYGIEYVDDPATGKKIPTCHRSSFDSVMDDSDFEQALENADSSARRVYREEAKAIEQLRRGIVAVSANEEPYDIFICYKETDENGDRTLDSVLAQDVYDALTDKGYRVFFSRISLEDKLGVEYEPYIFAALNSAKIMLAFGTDYEYFHAVWVKNEWSRFLKLMAKDKEKYLIPCYKGIDAYDMPREFAKLQAQDLGKVGAMQDLLRGIEKILPRQPETVAVQQSAVSSTAAPLLQRAFMFLEDGKWDSANEYLERVLDMEPTNGRAYLGKLMAALHVHTQERLGQHPAPFQNNEYYQKAARYGDAQVLRLLEDSMTAISQRLYTAALEWKVKADDSAAFRKAAQQFDLIAFFLDSRSQAEECRQLACQWEAEQQRIAAERQRLAAQQEAERKRMEAERQAAIYRKRMENQQAREKLALAASCICAGFNHTVGVKSDGTVVASCYTGDSMYNYNQCDVADWRKVISVSASWGHTVGLKTDGTVVAAGDNSFGQCDLGIWQELVAISTGTFHTVGLKVDGTVVTAGSNRNGQCNTENWSNMIAVSAGSSHTVGLKADGTVVATKYTGEGYEGQCDVSAWRDIVAVSAGSSHTVGLKADGTVVATKYIGQDYEGQCDVSAWRNILAVSAGSSHTVGLKADGTVVVTQYIGDEHEGQCDVGGWQDVVALSAGDYHTIGLKVDGSVLSTGANDSGQCDVNHWHLFREFENLAAEQVQEMARLESEEKQTWIRNGLCQHCGGEFRGLFGKKCVKCGNPKDY